MKKSKLTDFTNDLIEPRPDAKETAQKIQIESHLVKNQSKISNKFIVVSRKSLEMRKINRLMVKVFAGMLFDVTLFLLWLPRWNKKKSASFESQRNKNRS